MKISHFILLLTGLNIAGIYCSNYFRNDDTGKEVFNIKRHNNKLEEKYENFIEKLYEKALIEEIADNLKYINSLKKNKNEETKYEENIVKNDLIAKSEGATDLEKQVEVEQEDKIEPSLQKISQFRDNSEGMNKQKNDLLLLKQSNDFHFYTILMGCLIAGIVVIAATGFCLYAMHRSTKLNNSSDFPESQIKSQSKSVIRSGDKGLAHSAQMYHYQHQKQQMIAIEKANHDLKQDQSDNSDDGETDEGDYTVYECPGLAPTGEMEVKNPLFKEDFGFSNTNIQTEIENKEDIAKNTEEKSNMTEK